MATVKPAPEYLKTVIYLVILILPICTFAKKIFQTHNTACNVYINGKGGTIFKNIVMVLAVWAFYTAVVYFKTKKI